MYELTVETLDYGYGYARARLKKDAKIIQESAYLVNPITEENVGKELLTVAEKFLMPNKAKDIRAEKEEKTEKEKVPVNRSTTRKRTK